uniref:Zf-CCHC domain-containing protein/UBN2 domain-containing protein n=1 Tax=Tanacetum cinerariifolium TaxID=118510 RepID=A0A699GMA9_TANCI|nr:zf-CCHC domain-containing protein/UBN2 domain-containing protein [Tanacetum cinerariifolium]
MFPGLNMPLSPEGVCVVTGSSWFHKSLVGDSESRVGQGRCPYELIGNLKVYEVVLEKDSKASKNKKEKYNSLALKEKKVSSDNEVSYLDSDDKEYAMAARDFKKLFRRRGKFIRQPHDDKKNFQKAKEEKKGK